MTDTPAFIPPDQVDPRLTAHLEPGERVVWQGYPEFAGLMPLSSVIPMLLFGVIAIVVPTIITVTGDGEVPFWFPLLFAGTAIGVIAIFYVTKRNTAQNTAYALTDRRTLHVAGARMIRAEGPEKVEEVKIARRGGRHGDVYWRVVRRTTGSGKNRRTTTTLIGFLGVPEPEAVAARVNAWRGDLIARSAELAARFADAAEEGGIEALVRAGEAKRVSAPEAGVAFHAPSDWLRVDGGNVTDLSAAGGIVQMIQAISSGGNTVRLMSAGGGTFQVTGGNGPPPTSFAEASQSRPGLEVISADPEVQIGPWKGYAVAHKLSGVKLFGFTMFAADVLQRELWLDLGGRHLAVRMAAPTNAHELQRALDAIAHTLTPA